jgi:4-hydroxybenzoate polyprenyltransferase
MQTRNPSEDVTRGGIMDGDRSIKGVFQLGSRYPKQVAWVRVGVGIWLLLLTAILYSAGHGGQWAWLLVLVAALHFGLACRLFRSARKHSDRRVSFP